MASPKILTRMYFNCLICEKEFWRVPSQVLVRPPKFCSKPCKGKHMTIVQAGSNNRWWKGGISSENRRIRYSAAMKRWRVSVFERDDYTCQICGVRGGYLEADHIKPFAYYPDLRFELSNGRTLCRPCHQKTETWGTKNGKYQDRPSGQGI